MKLKVGDLVEVRTAEEILATLDEKGELDALPFMPEMLPYCGRRLTVHKIANKLCDTIDATGMRRMTEAVHLTAARCDGSAHDGCQTECVLYFKTAWLKPVAAGSAPPAPTAPGRLLTLLEANTRAAPGPDGEPRYRCQSTELNRASPEQLPLRALTQYVEDVRYGNTGVWLAVRALLFTFFNRYQQASVRLLPKPLRLRGGMPWGFVPPGPHQGRTPVAATELRPGELVRIKSKSEIVATLNVKGFNRGLGFQEDMARACGKTARVRARIERCIDEKTGRMMTMKTPCVSLDDVVCDGAYKANCPRAFLPFWRENWLERVDGDQ